MESNKYSLATCNFSLRVNPDKCIKFNLSLKIGSTFSILLNENTNITLDRSRLNPVKYLSWKQLF